MSLASRGFPWYALRVKPRHEKSVAISLGSKGYTEFLPLYRGRHRSSRRFVDVQLPFFPGYVFCRFDPLDRLPIVTTPGVLFIVKMGNYLVPVDETEIAAVQAIVRSGLNSVPWPFLSAGDFVHIEEGPLHGLDGILVSVKSEERLVVSVTLLSRSVAVEIDRRWVRPMPSPQPSVPRIMPSSQMAESAYSERRPVGLTTAQK